MSEVIPTDRELEALKVLWARGRATVRDVNQELSSREGELAYTTVLSLLQTMERKGLIGHEPAGKGYVYYAKVRRDAVFRSLAGGFVDRVFDGAMGEFVAKAIQSKKPGVAELEELEQMIIEAKRKARERSGGEDQA